MSEKNIIEEDCQSQEEEKESKAHKAHMLDVASSVISIELPCGYVKDGIIHKNAVLKEMTGVEEDIITSRGDITGRLNLIIFNCLVSLGNITEKAELKQAVEDMTGPDRLISLITLRRVTHGDFLDIKEICPNRECKAEGNHSINLLDVEVTPMEDSLVRDFEHQLYSGKKVCWHVLNMADETWLQSVRKKNKESTMTLNLMARVDSIDGKKIIRDGKNFRHALAALKKLTAKERGEMRQLFKKHEGSVDTETIFECSECGTEWKKEMPIGDASFFFPSV